MIEYAQEVFDALMLILHLSVTTVNRKGRSDLTILEHSLSLHALESYIS